MQTLVLDTNSPIKNLEQRGFSRAQVEAITDALKELDASSLITKSHLSHAVHVLQVAFEKPLHRQTWGLVGVIFAQGAFIMAVLHFLQ